VALEYIVVNLGEVIAGGLSHDLKFAIRDSLVARSTTIRNVNGGILVFRWVVEGREVGRALAEAPQREGGGRQHLVGVRTQSKQVVGGFDGREPLPRHHHGPRVVKALDGGPHGCFQLEDGRRGGVARVDGLLVLDQRQPQYAVGGLQGRLW